MNAELRAYLLEVCRVLGRAPLAARDALKRLGTLVQDRGTPLPIVFRVPLSTVAEAKLFRVGASSNVSHVSLTLASPIDLSTLATWLGAGSRQPSLQLRLPNQMVYRVAQPDCACDCTVLAALDGIPPDETAIALTMRRDPRADRE